MEFSIIFKQRFNRAPFKLILTAPQSICNNHLAELCAVITEMVDSYNIIACRFIQLMDGISDYGAPDMANVERFGNIRR